MPSVPAGRGAGGEGGRGQREQRERDRPGPLVGRSRPGPAHAGGLGEHRRDRGGEEGETGDHGACERTLRGPPSILRTGSREQCPHTLRIRSQGRYPAPEGVLHLRSAERTTGWRARHDAGSPRRRSPACRSTTGRCSRSPSTRSRTISSERLAELAGVNAAKVRKDLSYLGSYGTRGVGYDVEYLLHEISRELGLTRDWPVVIVGVGNLGRALANYRGFGARGFRVVALVDADPDLVGHRDRRPRRRARSTTSPRSCDERSIAIGIIATPGAGGPGGRRPARRRRACARSSTSRRR